jgi:hypothetical protein
MTITTTEMVNDDAKPTIDILTRNLRLPTFAYQNRPWAFSYAVMARSSRRSANA